MRIVLFDLDGTIADTLPMCMAAFVKAVEPYLGRVPYTNEIEQAYGLNEEGMIKQIVGRKWSEALHDFYNLYSDMHHMCPLPFDGIRPLIHQLKENGIKTGLVTGKGDYTTSFSLRYWGMQQDFDYIETGSPKKNRKPEAIESILHSNHIAKEDAIYIGDTVSDVISCQAVGIKCLSAAWCKEAQAKELENYNIGNVIYSISDLIDKILTNNK